MSNADAEKLVELWQKKHRHQFEGPRKAEGKLTTVIKELLVQKLESKAEKSGLQLPALSRRASIEIGEEKDQRRNAAILPTDGKVNVALQKKISSSSEASIILVGETGFLKKPLAIFAKLKSPIHLADLPEVDIPTRFFFSYTGPAADVDLENHEQVFSNIGVSLAVAFTDKDFVNDVHGAQNVEEVQASLDEYMSSLKILPKDWPEEQKIDPPANVRKKIKDEDEDEEIDEDRRYVFIFFPIFVGNYHSNFTQPSI